MGAQIRVPMDLLQDLASDLSALSSQFSGISTSAVVGSAIGAPEVLSALDTFTGNWSKHRGKLIDSIDAVQKQASESYKQFSKTDQDLANALLKGAK